MKKKEFGICVGMKSKFNSLCLCNITLPIINIIIFAIMFFPYRLLQNDTFHLVLIFAINLQICLLSAIPIFSLIYYCIYNIKWYAINSLYSELHYLLQNEVGYYKYSKSNFIDFCWIVLFMPIVNILLFMFMTFLFYSTHNIYYLEVLFSLTAPNYLLESIFIFIFTVCCICKMDWYERKNLIDKIQDS